MAEVNKEVYLKEINHLRKKIEADKDRGVLNGKARRRQYHLAYLEGLLSGKIQNRKSRFRLPGQDCFHRKGDPSWDRYPFLSR